MTSLTLSSIAACLVIATPVTNTHSPFGILAQDYAACAPVSLFVVAQLLELPVEWEEVRDLVGSAAEDGTHSFADLARAAEKLGLHPLALNATTEILGVLPIPAILQFRLRGDPKTVHFLVLLQRVENGVVVLDAPYQPRFMPDAEFKEFWSGNILVFAREQEEVAAISALIGSWYATPVRLLLVSVVCITLFSGLAALLLPRVRMSARWVACLRPQRSQGFLPIAVRFGAHVCVAVGLGVPMGIWAFQFYNSARAPVCVLDKVELYLGEVKVGAISTTVEIRNEGKAPLHIKGVKSTCSCAAVRVPNRVEPGQSVAMQVDLNVAPGPDQARLIIHTNDGAGERSVLLTWFGTAQTRLMPAWINEESAPLGQVFEKTVRVLFPGVSVSLLPHLEAFETGSSRVEIIEGAVRPAATQYSLGDRVVATIGELDLVVRVKPPQIPELFSAHCRLKVRYGESITSLVLPINVSFKGGALVPDVRSITFAGRSAGAVVGQERVVALEGVTSVGEIEILGLPDWLDCRVERKQSGRCELRFRVKGEPSCRIAHALVIIGTRREPAVRVYIGVNLFLG